MTTGLDQSLLQRMVRKFGPQRMLQMLDNDQRVALPYIWPIVARPKQLAPVGPWRFWILQSGRGFGKTRAGAEWVRGKNRRMPGSLGALIGQTPDEVRAIQIEGPAGILAVSPANERPLWEPSKGLLTWPLIKDQPTKAEVFSAAEPGKLRGPQHHWGWCDEFAKFAKARETFENANFGLRLMWHEQADDTQPQLCFTTTPRPIAIFRELVKRANCRVTLGSTRENRAHLDPAFFSELEQYAGTRLGKQELEGQLLDDVPGALWSREWFDRPGFRHSYGNDLRHFDLIVVSIDPAASNTDSSDETGIIVSGMWREGRRRRYHTLADVSVYGTVKQRVRAAICALVAYEANSFVVETNNGGDWIPAAIEAEWLAMSEEEAFKGRLPGRAPCHVVTATRGKHTRAEPISTLYEQLGTCSHEPGLEVLEDQLVTWSPLLAEKSPDRLDALVWALTYLSTAKVAVLT